MNDDNIITPSDPIPINVGFTLATTREELLSRLGITEENKK